MSGEEEDFTKAGVAEVVEIPGELEIFGEYLERGHLSDNGGGGAGEEYY